MNWKLIEGAAELQQAIAQNGDAAAVAVDTEFMRRRTFYPQAALVQLHFPGTGLAWLIDPLRVEDFSPLIDLFRKRSVMKILHAPGEDLEVFQRLLGVQPQPLFDTQRAAAFLDMGHGLSYSALVMAVSGQEVSKEETRSDWLARPLTSSQQKYAAQDVLFLPSVYQQLREQLAAAGKLQWLLEDGAQAAQTAALEEVPSVGRIKMAWKLGRRQLAVLMAVCNWREQRARHTDKPRGWILSDQHCLQLAQQNLSRLQDFQYLEDFPASVVRKQGKVLLQVIAQTLAVEEQDLPMRLPAPLDPKQRALLKQLKTRMRQMAKQWGVAPEILLPARDCELLARKLGGEPVREPALWSGWRGEQLLQPLLTQLG